MLYEELLAGAKRDPHGADFTELRLAYTQSTEYDPYSPPDDNTLTALATALDAGDLQGAIDAIGHLLTSRYLDIEAHTYATSVYKQLGDEVKSTYHKLFAEGLVRSIMQSGNGRSYQTAFVVVDVAEEYALLKVLGIDSAPQSLREYGGHHFDVFEIHNAHTGETTETYFNIDLPKLWLDRKLKEADAKQ